MKHLLKKLGTFLLLATLSFQACKKDAINEISATAPGGEATLRQEAEKTVQEQQSNVAAFEKEFIKMLTVASPDNSLTAGQKNIVKIASSLPFLKSLVAAVVKTDLAGTLSSASLHATVFAPTDAAFAKLPAPFNTPASIASISDPAQIAALKNILLYHVLGAEVKKYQIQAGRSNAITLKPAVAGNDNTIYISKSLGLLFVKHREPV